MAEEADAYLAGIVDAEDMDVDAASRKRQHDSSEATGSKKVNRGGNSNSQSSQQDRSKPARSKGNKGAPKGGGKGNSTGLEGLSHAVELNRRAALRLLQTQRELQQVQTYIVEIPSTSTNIRSNLLLIADKWKQERPTTGAHPRGPLHRLQWRYMVNTWGEALQQMECISNEQREQHDKLKDFISAHFPHPQGIITKFVPLGRNRDKAPEGTWFWSLNYDLTLRDGRDTHEKLRDLIRAGNSVFVLFDISFRHDRGAPDTLEKELRALSIS
jgi:hypothetical protein